MTAQEVEQRFPEAVAFARQMREVFGEIHIIYARNQRGEEIKLRGFSEKFKTL